MRPQQARYDQEDDATKSTCLRAKVDHNRVVGSVPAIEVLTKPCRNLKHRGHVYRFSGAPTRNVLVESNCAKKGVRQGRDLRGVPAATGSS